MEESDTILNVEMRHAIFRCLSLCAASSSSVTIGSVLACVVIVLGLGGIMPVIMRYGSNRLLASPQTDSFTVAIKMDKTESKKSQEPASEINKSLK